jgi:formate-dependent nitrite reductase membrane component NrfD
MESFEWMAKYTPQTEWIRRRGILLWLAFFFIELGAGIFFVATFFGNLQAMLAGWLVCAALGGGFHLLFLGHPWRFWRMMFSSGWKTSWISRGIIFVSLFLFLGLICLLLKYLTNAPLSLLVGTDVFAFLTIIYGGFAMNYVNSIPLWNTALLPVLYLVSGLWGGAEIVSGFALATGSAGTTISVEEWLRLLFIGFVVLIPVYLMSVRYTSPTGQVSVRQMVTGRWAPLFWSGVVAVGMAIPLAAVATSLVTGIESVPETFLYVAIVCGLVGDLAMRYLLLSCGYYSPLIPSSGPLVIQTKD